jgi:hypothetical protein
VGGGLGGMGGLRGNAGRNGESGGGGRGGDRLEVGLHNTPHRLYILSASESRVFNPL